MSHQYKTHFNSVGEPIEPPFRFVDLVALAFLFGVVTALISGVFG